MAKAQRIIEPRMRTPAPGLRDNGATATSLPDDLQAQQCTRLTVLYGVAAALWTIGLVMQTWVLPHDWRWGPHIIPIHALGILAGLLMVVYASVSPCGHQRKTNVGLGFFVANALAIGLLNSWNEQPTDTRPLSWITIVILIYAMIAPASPRKMLGASLVAATMDPLGVWIAHLRGLPVPSPLYAFLMFFPNYVCAGLAVLPSQVLHRLGRQIRTARELGSYQLVELLGRGGMGEVWRADHRLLARSAAIKLVRPEVLGASTTAEARLILRRFEREAQATAALGSPHTIRLFDFGMTDEGTFYYVMELLTGRDLESLIHEFGPLPAERALYLLRQACHSLADAHSRGLVHRDVKPANIYVCRMGLDYDFVKVLDFGLVKVRDKSIPGQTLLTAEHATTGTPAYMAPEIILGEADVDRRADVYALGCVAYYMLTGQLVFEADTPMKMLVQHVQSAPIPPSQRTELEIPRALDELVLACLQKNPDNRPQDAQELFELSSRCAVSGVWTTGTAQAWWQTHLPEFTAPPAIIEPESEVLMRAVGV